MSGGGGTQTTTQSQTLPPEYQAAFNSIMQQANQLQPNFQQERQYIPGTPASFSGGRDTNFGGGGDGRFGGYGGSNFGSGYFSNSLDGGTFTPATQGQWQNVGDAVNTGGPTSIVPDLSSQTLQGIDLLSAQNNPEATALLQNTVGGNFLNSNPNTGAVNAGQLNPFADNRNSIAGVLDAIQAASTKSVGDRFSQAGRSGGPGEGLALGTQVARELAPFAFGANEANLTRGFNANESLQNRQFDANSNAANRGFQSFENERGRQINAGNQLMGLNAFRGNNLLQGGSILENQQRQQMREPFDLFNLRTEPLIRAVGGAPMSQSTTQPVNRNRVAGALGGAATGAKIGSLVPGIGTAIGAGVGGLLGYI